MYIYLRIFLMVLLVSLSFNHKLYAKKQITGAKLISKNQCLKCHSSSNSLDAPIIHGMDKKYLIKQLNSFKVGSEEFRENIFMNEVVKNFDKKEIEKIAQFFSSKTSCRPSSVTSSHALIEKGKISSITCKACHNANSPLGAPVLEGQNANYLKKQILNIKSGKRKVPMMQALVGGLTEKDISNISSFFGSQKYCEKKSVKPKEAILTN